MKTIELEKFIQNLSPDLYSFAYILIPDDLQATQLMIDAVSVVMIQKISILDKWMMTSVDKSQATFEEIKRLSDVIKESSINEYKVEDKKKITELKKSLISSKPSINTISEDFGKILESRIQMLK